MLYPVGELLASVHVPLPPLPASYVLPYASTFTVTAVESTLNAVTRTRHLTLEINHPGIIWTVIAFEGDVREWDMSHQPPRGRRLHRIKEVSAYGQDRWQLRLVLQLDEAQFGAAQRINQRRKGQRPDDTVGEGRDAELAGLRVQFSGLEEAGHWRRDGPATPARDFTKRFDAALPGYVDAMLLTAVAGVATV